MESPAWPVEVKGNKVRFWALEGNGSWKCRGLIRGLLIDSWIKCSSLISSSRTKLCSYYWLRKRTSEVTGFLPGRNLDILVFSLLCHTAEEPRLCLVPLHLSPAAVSHWGKRQTKASFHPFHPTTSLPISFHAFSFLTCWSWLVTFWFIYLAR